jgi:hypothetical protein
VASTNFKMTSLFKNPRENYSHPPPTQKILHMISKGTSFKALRFFVELCRWLRASAEEAFGILARRRLATLLISPDILVLWFRLWNVPPAYVDILEKNVGDKNRSDFRFLNTDSSPGYLFTPRSER